MWKHTKYWYVSSNKNHFQIFIVTCSSVPCRNGGTCYQGPFTYECSCPNPYRGQQCESITSVYCKFYIQSEEEKNVFFFKFLALCDSNPCRNGGTCTINGSTYACSCAPGYTGNACGTNIRPSRSDD